MIKDRKLLLIDLKVQTTLSELDLEFSVSNKINSELSFRYMGVNRKISIEFDIDRAEKRCRKMRKYADTDATET